jgi:hypothetical protein
MKSKPRLHDRQIERPTVERDDGVGRPKEIGCRQQHPTLVSHVVKEILTRTKRPIVIPPKTDEEGDGSGASAQTGRLEIEAHDRFRLARSIASVAVSG